MSYHQSEIGMAIIKIEINTDVAISFAHSQYDKIGFQSAPPPRQIIAELNERDQWAKARHLE